ncbi:hypothetical protein BJS_02041 [Bradyrhizobium japonicum SEMIA 5079]|nr:hypothetical protein BJS_02041 [Bradyrhizobium japonicum SEMIA 5079]
MMPAIIAGAVGILHGRPQRFDHDRSVHDIDTSISGEPKPAAPRYKLAPIAIEANRWRQACDRHISGWCRASTKRSAAGR